MDLLNYQKASARTCNDLETPLLDNIHMTSGMVTEVGEIVDIFKKHIAYGKSIDWVNVEEELGDLLWYIVNFARKNNIDLEKTMGINISKLYARYPEKFTNDQALVRDLEKEREILEKGI